VMKYRMRSVRVWNLVSHIEGVWEQCAEENIRA
jgi:hypothetical protein